MSEFDVLNINGLDLADGINYITVIPDLDAMAEQSVDVVRGQHTHPEFFLPTPLERVLTAQCWIVPQSNAGPHRGFDPLLDQLKSALDTFNGPITLTVKRPGQMQRTLSVHTRQFAVNRIERKATWQWVAADPFWTSVVNYDQSTTMNVPQLADVSTLTWLLETNGTQYVRPKLKIKINSATSGQVYYRWIRAHNQNQYHDLPAGTWVEITDGAGFDTATLVGAGKMRSDGNDLHIYYNDIDVPRYLVGMNTASTKIWVRLPVALPHRDSQNFGGDYGLRACNLAPGSQSAPSAVTSTTGSLAGYEPKNAVAVTGWGSDGCPSGDNQNVTWRANAVSTSIKIDLLSSKSINEIDLLHLNSNECAKDYTISYSVDDITYTPASTVTGNNNPGAWNMYEYGGFNARYIKVSITANNGGSVSGLNKIKIYWVGWPMVISYGLPNAPQPSWPANPDGSGPMLAASSVAFIPMFDPANSTNQTWTFGGSGNNGFASKSNEGQYRTPQWIPTSITANVTLDWFTAPCAGGGHDETLVTALGSQQTGRGTQDGWLLQCYTPILNINVKGDQFLDPGCYKAEVLAKKWNAAFPDQIYITGGGTPWCMGWGPSGVVNLPAYNGEASAYYSLYYHLRQINYDPNGHNADINWFQFQFVSGQCPTSDIDGQERTSAYNYSLYIYNPANAGTLLSYTVIAMPPTANIVIDCDARTITRDDTGQNLLNAIGLAYGQPDWLLFNPGLNGLKLYTDVTSGNFTIEATWKDRWL